jgi:hypothetical protein
MPQYHVHVSYIKAGHGSASDFARYIAREDLGEAVKHSRYISRQEEGRDRDDLIAAGHGNLPAWTCDSPALFWQAADTLERKNGVVARQIEIALPRELSPQGREDLAADIRAVLMGKEFAYSFAIHEPPARDHSGIMPHMHLLFSPRAQTDNHERTMEQWFQQPNHGGVRKDPSWETKGRLYDVRESVAVLSNAALSREGFELAVDHRRLKDRGLARPVARYGDRPLPDDIKGLSVAEREQWRKDEKQRTLDYRQAMRENGLYDFEQQYTHMRWVDQRRELLSIEGFVRDTCKK